MDRIMNRDMNRDTDRDSNRMDAVARREHAAGPGPKSQREHSTGRERSGSQGRDGIAAELIRELTRRERLVLMLRYTEELTVAEIAAVLEIATAEVERMLESISERVRRRVQPVYGRTHARLA